MPSHGSEVPGLPIWSVGPPFSGQASPFVATCILSCLNVMRAVAMWACQPIAGRGLAYAKIMQARGKQAGLQFPERSLSYAKIQHFIASTKCLAIFRSGNTKKLVHDAEANANTWHGGKAESTYPHTGSSSRNRLGTTANRQTRHATIGLATAHRCKSLYRPGHLRQTSDSQRIAIQQETTCQTAPTGMQNGRYWPVKRAVWLCKRHRRQQDRPSVSIFHHYCLLAMAMPPNRYPTAAAARQWLETIV